VCTLQMMIKVLEHRSEKKVEKGNVLSLTASMMQGAIPHTLLRKKRRSHSPNPAPPPLSTSSPSNPLGMSVASASRDSFANSHSSRNNYAGATSITRASTARSHLSSLASCGAPPSYSFSQATFAHDLCSQDRLRSVTSTQVLFSLPPPPPLRAALKFEVLTL
jgi:hypothetical protein